MNYLLLPFPLSFHFQKNIQHIFTNTGPAVVTSCNLNQSQEFLHDQSRLNRTISDFWHLESKVTFCMAACASSVSEGTWNTLRYSSVTSSEENSAPTHKPRDRYRTAIQSWGKTEAQELLRTRGKQTHLSLNVKASYRVHVFTPVGLLNYTGYRYGYSSPLDNRTIRLPNDKSDSVSVRGIQRTGEMWYATSVKASVTFNHEWKLEGCSPACVVCYICCTSLHVSRK